MPQQKSILICPLDWGLGHASRMVPIIKRLNESGYHIVIAADGAGLSFLRSYFPQLKYYQFPGFKPVYSRSNSQVFQMLRSVPKILKSFRKDHHFVEKLICDEKIDGLISDNRFGAYTKQIPSVFITHQLHIRVPDFWLLFKPLLDMLNKYYISRFGSCWIPDNMHEPRLSGDLSLPVFKGIKTAYIGTLSRFSQLRNIVKKDIDVLFLLSGPEPHRSLLEEKIIAQSANFPAKFCLLRGLPGEKTASYYLNKNLTAYDHADDETFSALIQRSKMIVARAGYSSIMDLAALGRSAWLVPTPGQTEQEYLATYLSQKKWFKAVNQHEFELSKILNSNIYKNLEPLPVPNTISFEIIDNWLASL